ncbi:MAG TPA: hypothetical protein VD735_06700 [Candidatus Saccharimonadales bacterium]|nr:hypothetical protein [Candidatus Saccharimonadales bacterium]
MVDVVGSAYANSIICYYYFMNGPTADKISVSEQDMFDTLFAAYMAVAEPTLQKDKYLVPVGMRLSKNGEPSLVGLMPEGDVDSDPAVHLRVYRKLLNQTSAGDVACLLAYDVRLKENAEYEDAINIELEAKSGARAQLVIPYKFSGWRKKLQLGPVARIQPGAARIYLAS